MYIPKIVIRLVDPDGFNAVFEEQLPEFVEMGLTYKDTFHALNMIYKQHFGIKRYSSYDSFRRVRSRKINSETKSQK